MEIQIFVSFVGYLMVGGWRGGLGLEGGRGGGGHTKYPPRRTRRQHQRSLPRSQVLAGCVVANRLIRTKFGEVVDNRSRFLKNKSEMLDGPQTICSLVVVILWVYKTYACAWGAIAYSPTSVIDLSLDLRPRPTAAITTSASDHSQLFIPSRTL